MGARGGGCARSLALLGMGRELALEAKERVFVAVEEDELGGIEGEQALDKRDADGAARAGDEDAASAEGRRRAGAIDGGFGPTQQRAGCLAAPGRGALFGARRAGGRQPLLGLAHEDRVVVVRLKRLGNEVARQAGQAGREPVESMSPSP